MGWLLLGQIPLMLEDFARGGGGGSGGGGSGGSGGGGSILVLIGLIGYFPMYFLGSQLRKHFYKDYWVAAKIIGWVIAGILALICFGLMFVEKSFLLGFYVNIPIGIGVIVGMATGLSAVAGKINRNHKIKKAVATYAAKDTVWDEKNILKFIEGIFYKFQLDWSQFDATSMQKYMSTNYYNHTNLMLYALKGAHRVNKVLNPQLISYHLATAHDSDNNDEDMFEVAITAVADDQLFDDRTNTLLFKDKNAFTEYWRFIRKDNNWLFDGIRQQTQTVSPLNNPIAQFAQQNNLFFSPDWGWLLLPSDGYLFNNGKFGISDINNHTIGVVNTVLTQLYTYTPVPVGGNDQYLVVQTNVPKSYGRILVRRRSKFINWPVKGLTQVKMEWGEFNDTYDVFASDLEKVTSFELLNPAFMAQLRDLPFEVNIEVVDNVVYLFTKANTDVSIYASLYEILLKAHKEMKL